MDNDSSAEWMGRCCLLILVIVIDDFSVVFVLLTSESCVDG